jgi:hypothetical protein
MDSWLYISLLAHVKNKTPKQKISCFTLTTTQKILRGVLKLGSKAGEGINRGGHFLLTEAVTVNRLTKLIYRDGQSNATASVNIY